MEREEIRLKHIGTYAIVGLHRRGAQFAPSIVIHGSSILGHERQSIRDLRVLVR